MTKRTMFSVALLTSTLLSGAAQANINQSLNQVCQSVQQELALNTQSGAKQTQQKRSLRSRSFANMSCSGRTLVMAKRVNAEKSVSDKSASVQTFLR